MRLIYAHKRQKKGPQYKFGERVPRSIKEAYEIDRQTGTTGWTDAINLEVTSLKDKFSCFEILEENAEIDKSVYQYIKLIWVFDVKFDGRKRA